MTCNKDFTFVENCFLAEVKLIAAGVGALAVFSGGA